MNINADLLLGLTYGCIAGFIAGGLCMLWLSKWAISIWKRTSYLESRLPTHHD